MYFSIFPKYDSTIYEKYPARNTGIDQILELRKLTPYVADENGCYWAGTYNSRILIKFDLSDIETKVNSGEITGSTKYYLNLRATEAQDLPIDFTFYAYPISGSWVNGNGHFNDSPQITNGVSWLYMDGYYNQTGSEWNTNSASYAANTTASYTTNAGGGNWYTNYTGSQSFSYEDPDIRMDVTTIVNAWLSGSIPNEGFIIKKSDTDEQSVNDLGSAKFFGKDTHTVFVPRLEAVWNNQTYNTGSSTIANDDFVIFPSNLKNEYEQKEKARIKLVARDRFPTKTFSTSSAYLNTEVLPSSSYWAVYDYSTKLEIVPFSDNHLISTENGVSYFDFDFNTLIPERYYKFVFKVEESTYSHKFFDSDFYFKVNR
jgi:hypothetical protein